LARDRRTTVSSASFEVSPNTLGYWVVKDDRGDFP
jgi:hypothetical protein